MTRQVIKGAPSPIREVRVVSLIRIGECRGAGTNESPKRTVLSYWDMDGNLLWSDDPAEGMPVEP